MNRATEKSLFFTSATRRSPGIELVDEVVCELCSCAGVAVAPEDTHRLMANLLALLGRRLAGHLRWYHLGWLPVLVGLFGTYWYFSLPLLRSLTNGLVWELTGKVIDAVRGERLITESMQARSHIDFTALLVTIFGLAILLLGRRHERKRTPTKME